MLFFAASFGVTLFMKGGVSSRIVRRPSPALALTIVVARWTRSALRGLIVGTILVSTFSGFAEEASVAVQMVRDGLKLWDRITSLTSL